MIDTLSPRVLSNGREDIKVQTNVNFENIIQNFSTGEKEGMEETGGG